LTSAATQVVDRTRQEKEEKREEGGGAKHLDVPTIYSFTASKSKGKKGKKKKRKKNKGRPDLFFYLSLISSKIDRGR